MLSCQSHLFDLPKDIHYLNGAYMSPQLHSVTAAGQAALLLKQRPYKVVVEDFFQPLEELKQLFAQLIEADDPQRIAIIPSVSYGISNITKNIEILPHQHIIMVDEQFPSNYYPWKRLIDESGATINIISPEVEKNRTDNWNTNILNAINSDTKAVVISHAHWADGTRFDLKKIREKTNKVEALLIVDGTQSVGALPFSMKEYEVDALICAGYKWLLGPYSFGLAYYGKAFDDGMPIEENWINRYKSDDFKGLVKYEDRYRPLANRYSVGEQSNFILAPMLSGALQQLLDWGVENMQSYCHSISSQAVEELREMGCKIEAEDKRCGHLFGVRLPDHIKMEELKQLFTKEQVYVSIRGDAIRISPNVYNTKVDFEHLLYCFRSIALK